MVKRVQLTKAGLRKPLPSGLTKQQVLTELQKRIQKVEQTKSLTTPRKPGTSMVARGMIGTSFAQNRIEKVGMLAANGGKQGKLARAIGLVHTALSTSGIELEARDHQVLVNIVNKLGKSSSKNAKPLKLTLLEEKTLKQYYRANTGKELEL
ncbi:MAG: hypothetical protein WC821_00640 [archaeon]|jgi:hypothetical protein